MLLLVTLVTVVMYLGGIEGRGIQREGVWGQPAHRQKGEPFLSRPAWFEPRLMVSKTPLWIHLFQTPRNLKKGFGMIVTADITTPICPGLGGHYNLLLVSRR